MSLLLVMASGCKIGSGSTEPSCELAACYGEWM